MSNNHHKYRVELDTFKLKPLSEKESKWKKAILKKREEEDKRQREELKEKLAKMSPEERRKYHEEYNSDRITANMYGGRD